MPRPLLRCVMALLLVVMRLLLLLQVLLLVTVIVAVIVTVTMVTRIVLISSMVSVFNLFVVIIFFGDSCVYTHVGWRMGLGVTRLQLCNGGILLEPHLQQRRVFHLQQVIFIQFRRCRTNSWRLEWPGHCQTS